MTVMPRTPEAGTAGEGVRTVHLVYFAWVREQIGRATERREESADKAADIAKLAGVHDARVEADQLTFDVDTDALGGVLAALTKAGVASLAVSPPSLEELFLRHYGDRIENEPVTR